MFEQSNVSKGFWCVWCILYYNLLFVILNTIFGFCVFFCIYEVEQMCFGGNFEKMFQKCEQFSYEIFGVNCLGFWVLNGPLTSLKRPSEGYNVAEASLVGGVIGWDWAGVGLCWRWAEVVLGLSWR